MVQSFARLSQRPATYLYTVLPIICELHVYPKYYILNKEIQEFLVKIKMLFLRSLEIFISSREINLCRFDTFPTMVANSQLCATGYRLLDYFEFCSVCSCSYTQVSNMHELPLSIANKKKQTLSDIVFFLNKACGVFQECRTVFPCEFIHFI